MLGCLYSVESIKITNAVPTKQAIQYCFINVPASMQNCVIGGNSLPKLLNISWNAGNTNINIIKTATIASATTIAGYTKAPITLPLTASCFFNNSNMRFKVLSSSPESSPAFTRPIYTLPKISLYFSSVSPSVVPPMISFLKL